MSERTYKERWDWLEKQAKMVMLGDTPGYTLSVSWDAVDNLTDSVDAWMSAIREEPT